MGNCQKYAINEEKLIEAESKLFKLTGMELNEFKISNVVINDQQDYVRTIQCGKEDGEKVVLVHGYGGSGLIFFKIIKQLAEHFNLYLIDVIGMGASSRPKFDAKTATEADDFFVNFLESWRKAMNLTNFYLCGHSFGGYICGHYAYRYPEHLKKILMLSPAGVVWVPPDFDITKMKFKNGKAPSKMVKSIATSIWEKKWSPFGVMRKSGKLIGKKIIKSYLNKRMNMLNDEEQQIMLDYMYQIFMKEGSTEYAIFICFKVGMFAENPLETENRLGNPDLPIPVSFFYGDQDWMDRKGGDRTVERNKFADTLSFVYIINNSDHHMYLDNPDEFAKAMIHDIQYTNDRYELVGEQYGNHITNRITKRDVLDRTGEEESKSNDQFDIESDMMETSQDKVQPQH